LTLFPRKGDSSTWDLTALLNAADGLSGRAQRHLWLARLMEWLRHAPRSPANSKPGAGDAATHPALLRLRHLLNVLEKNPEYQQRVQRLFVDFWADIRSAGLFSDYGFGPRMALSSEIWDRLRLRLLPTTPDTRELAELFPLLFKPTDVEWLSAIDDATLQRLASPAWRSAEAGPDGWREEMLDAVTYLISAVRAAGFSGALRKRMSEATLAGKPFRQLAASSERLREAVIAGDLNSATVRQEAGYLRVLLDQCRVAVDSIAQHLEEYGISVDIVYEADQLRARVKRIEQLLDCVLSPQPARELLRLTQSLVQMLEFAAVAPLCPAVAQGGRAQRRDRRALHRPHTRRIPRHAAACGRRRRRAGRHHTAEVRRHGVGAHSLLERLLGRHQLCGELRRHHAAALDRGHQAAGDDCACDGTAPGRPEEQRIGGSLR
jgi:site-specific recombinase